MQPISIAVPKQLIFDNVSSPIRMLTIQNTCLEKLAFKIRTNHKTAMSLNVTHDFLAPMSKRQIPIKLIEIHEGVKLEINYTKATQQMIIKNDAKMVAIEKKDIKKSIVQINVSSLMEKKIHNVQKLAKTYLEETSMATNPNEKDKSMNSSIYKIPSNNQNLLDVVRQHPEEDEEQFDEKKKVLEIQLSTIEGKIEKEKQELSSKRQEITEMESRKKNEEVYKIHYLAPILILAFFFGSLIKMFLY